MAKLYFKVASDWQEVVRLRNEIAKLKQELKVMDSTQSPAAFNTLNTQLSASTKRMDELVTNAAKAGAEIDGKFKKKIFDASQVVNGLTEKIISQKSVVKDVESDVKRLGEAYRIALKRNPLSAGSKLEEYNAARKALDEEKAVLFDLTQQQAEARLSVKRLRDEYSLYNDDAKEVVESNNGIAISWKKALAIIGGAGVLKALVSEMIRVRGEFQAADTAIQTLLGSKEKADALMSQVREYAKISPLEFSDVTQATQQMLGFNIEAEKVPRFISAIGDISMGETPKFNSLTLAFSQMSATGKLMGQDLNQMINAGFNPLQIMSEKTGKSIAQLKDEMSKGAISAEMVQQAFIDATSAGGKFYKMSENASKTINGQLSMMQDAMDSVFNELGQKSEGVIMGSIQMTTSLIENYETIGKVLAGLVATYGTYRTAVMLTTLATSKHTIAEIALTNARVLARKAQMALNAAMLTNPYVALATVVVGLTATMWAMSDSTTAAARAQKEYNDIKENALKKEQEHKRRIDELLTAARDESLATLTRQKSLEELRKEYPKIFGQYDIEKLKLEDILKLKQLINEEDSKQSVQERKESYTSLKQTVAYQQRYLQLFDNPELRKNMSDADKEIWKMFSGKQSYVQVREQMEKNSELLKKYQKDVLDDNISAYKANLKNYSKERLEEELKLAKSSASKRNGFAVNGMMVNGGDLESIISSINVALVAKKSPTTYQQDLAAAKADWEKAKKGYEAILKDQKATSEQVKNARDEMQAKEKSYKDLGGETGSSLAKQENQAKKQLEQQERLSEQLISIRQKNQQDEINLMEEGRKKKLAQINADFETQKQAIEKQAKELAKSNKEAGFANLNKNGLTQEQQEEINKAVALNVESLNKSITDLYKSPIEQYQSYTDERIAIEKKFNDDIALLQEARRQAEEKGDADEIAKIDRSIAKATAEKGKSLMKHDFDVLKQSPEYIRAFEDLKNTSSETLNSLLSQLENAKQVAAETLNPEDLQEYTTTIQEIMDELDARNPFKALADRQKELAEAERELVEAKRQLDAVNRGERIVTGVNTYLSAADALNKYNAAKDKHQKANNNFIKAEKAARDKVDELALAIKGVGDAIGGQAGEIISLMGDVALFATGTIDGITRVTKTGVDAISAVEKASVILGIISTAIQLLQKISELGSNKAFRQYEAYAEKIKEINALTDAVNEYRIAALEAQQAEANWFSVDNLKNLRDYKALHDEVAKAYADKAMEAQAIYQNKSGGGWLTGAFNWLMGNLSALSWWDNWKDIWGQGDYEKGMTAAVNNLRIETRKASSGFLGTGIGGKSQKTEDLITWARNQGLGELFDKEGMINKELAQSIIDNYGNKLVGQTKETLEALIELRKQYDEYLNQLHEYVSSLYEPLVDNFVDSLWDWLDNGKDALDSFKDYASSTFRDIVSDMMRTIVLDKVVGTFSDDIAALYEEYAKGAIDETELMKKISERTSGLIDNYQQNIPTLQNIMDEINGYLQDAGIDLKKPESTSQQKATAGGFETMSQDTATELNGRFTALQIAGEEIKSQSIAQSESLNLLTVKMDTILSIGSETRNIADETRDIMARSYLELQQISENTGAIVKPILKMQADIAEVKKNTSKL